jgi:hypothetical protein
LKVLAASFFWAAVGIPIGAVAAVIGFVLLLLASGGGGSTDGSAWYGVWIVPAFGAAVGFLLGFAFPIFRHAWRIRRFGPVVGGALTGAVAGLLLLILTGPWLPEWALAASAIVAPLGAVAGLLLGFAPPPGLRLKPPIVGPVLGFFAGGAAGLVLWAILAAWATLSGSYEDIAPALFAYCLCGSVLGLLLGFPAQLIWRGWKRRTTAGQSPNPPG